jgi:hypothetical protein
LGNAGNLVSSGPMPLDPLYLVLELGAAGFFAWAAVAALRRGRLPFLELISAATFGILLEEGDQLIFETYHYSPHFLLTIDRAPIVIGLTWALIIAGAMRITDALGVRRRYAPFVDAILAISLDLAFDAIAIRVGLWTWRGIGPNEGWFGVPAGNFNAWLWVTLAFSLMSRWLRDGAASHPGREWLQLLVPIPAYVILLVGMMPFAYLRPVLDPEPGGGLGIFLVSLVAFAAVAAYGVWGPDRAPSNGERSAMLDLRVAFSSRVAIHSFFLTALVLLGLVPRVPMLLGVALLLLALELPLARLVRSRRVGETLGHSGPIQAGRFAKQGSG